MSDSNKTYYVGLAQSSINNAIADLTQAEVYLAQAEKNGVSAVELWIEIGKVVKRLNLANRKLANEAFAAGRR